MPDITLRQAVMIVQKSDLGREGDKESLQQAAALLGVRESHGLGGLDEAAENFARNQKRLAAAISNIDVGDGSPAARVQACEQWLQQNQARYGDEISIPSIAR